MQSLVGILIYIFGELGREMKLENFLVPVFGLLLLMGINISYCCLLLEKLVKSKESLGETCLEKYLGSILEILQLFGAENIAFISESGFLDS